MPSGPSLDRARRAFAIPNVAEAHRVAVILKMERTFFREGAGFRAAHVSGCPFQFSMILRQYSIDEHRDIARVQRLAIFVNGPAKDDVINLKLAGWPQRI